MSAAAVLEKPAGPPKLVKAREEAIAFIQNQIKKGSEIKAMRIRSGPELDQARAAKLEWTNVTTDLLKELFDSSVVAEECNDWVGKIYPEYAEFGNFVEQFYAEMDHRLKRLKAVIRQVQKVPSETRATAPAAAVPVAPPPAPLAVPVTTVEKPTHLMESLHGLLLIFGADEASKTSVSEFLDSLDVQVTLVDEAMKNVPETLDEARDASFAVVLVAEPQPDRSFELGLCAGRLGLKRVCIIHPQHAQIQPDARGLTHLALDPSGGWQLVLARHLKRAGLGVDLNRLC